MNYLKWMRAQWDRCLAVLAVIGSGIALLLGWLGVSNSVLPAQQTPYLISGGLFGVCLLGFGGALWLSADLRDEWRKLDRIEQVLRGEERQPSLNGQAGFTDPLDANSADGSQPDGQRTRA
jgi:hypothetical protein